MSCWFVMVGLVPVGCGPLWGPGKDEGMGCNDDDSSVFPGADEVCDGIDNDCDGMIDEGDALDAALWFLDADGDGYGADHSIVTSCSQPAGYVDQGGDCDDQDPDLNPDTYWYADADLDGFGDPGEFEQQCIQLAGYVADDTDCDDTRDDVNPGEEERCDDVDHDCDGDVGMVDADADGVAECEGDCDDHDATIYPGATETVGDGVDSDCDGDDG